ncbi:pyridoxal-phosphate dependent enzyme [Sorangium sp. So ce327]
MAQESPLEDAPRLSARLGNRVLIKREDLQPVFSFKLRGAYNKISSLSAAEKGRGVIAASAGNHAQGVALAAQRLGIRACIVMPTTTPRIKVDAVRALGAEIELIGDSYDEAYAHAKTLEASEGLTFVHPYDDPDVIAGQGTIALEIMRQHRGSLDAIFVPVGGGGLIAGIGAYIKHLYPEIDLSMDEMAKLHVRYMVGGRAPTANERLLRFEVPERPGALMQFLTHIGGRWNISLFHYRNHGAAFGRVLAALQVPEPEYDEFDRFLTDLGYPFIEETKNAAYHLFLR